MAKQEFDDAARPSDDPVPDMLTSEAATMPAQGSPVAGTELTASESENAPRPIDYAAPMPAGARWRVGTLSYTTGGLVLVFLLLLGGDFALSMRDRSIGPPIQYMFKRLQASNTLNTVTFLVLPPLLSLIIGPIVSFKSDRLRSRWGRRIPYLLVPAPFAAAAMVVISYSEPLGQALSNLLGPHSWFTAQRSALTFFVLAWTVFEVAALTAAAVLNGLINDVVPRPLLGRFYGLFRQVSLGAGMIFNRYLIKYSESHYRVIFISLAVLFLVGFGAMCLGVKEGDYPPPEPVDPNDSAARRFKNNVRTYFRECFVIPYYLWAFFAMAMAACAFQPVNTFTVFYAQQLGISKESLGEFLFLTYGISFVLALPLGWLVDKAHALRVSLVVMAIYAVTMICAYAFVKDSRTFGIVLIIHGVLSGTYFTTSSPLGQALFPRLKFAQFASAGGLIQSLLTVVLGLTLGPLLDLMNNYYRLTFIMGGLFGVMAVGAMVVVYVTFNRLGGMRDYVPPEAGDSRNRGFDVVPK